MFKIKKEKLLHDIFIISIIVKAIDGFLEFIGGIVLLSIKSESISKIIQTIFHHEIIQDPTDFIANHLIQFSQNLSISTISFVAIYLMVNGFIKVGLFLGLRYKRLWAYPAAGILLSFFVIYQLVRFFNNHSIVLIFFILIDIVIITLLRSEYKRLRQN